MAQENYTAHQQGIIKRHYANKYSIHCKAR